MPFFTVKVVLAATNNFTNTVAKFTAISSTVYHLNMRKLTCKPMAVSFQCMTKFTTNKKKIKKKIKFWQASKKKKNKYEKTKLQ